MFNNKSNASAKIFSFVSGLSGKKVLEHSDNMCILIISAFISVSYDSFLQQVSLTNNTQIIVSLFNAYDMSTKLLTCIIISKCGA